MNKKYKKIVSVGYAMLMVFIVALYCLGINIKIAMSILILFSLCVSYNTK